MLIYRTKDNNKDIICTNNKVNSEADYFDAGTKTKETGLQVLNHNENTH